MTPVLFNIGCIILLISSILPLVFTFRPNRTSRRIALYLLIGGLGCLLAFAAARFSSPAEINIDLFTISSGLNLSLHLDRLSVFFMAIISAVGICCAIYSLGYVEHDASGIKRQLMTALTSFFILMMLMVTASGNMFAFVFFWEAMSISSFFLVMYDYEKAETQRAGLFYFVMTQLSTVFLMLAFFSIYRITGSLDIQAAAGMAPLAKSLIFVALFVGFGIKAGLIPFHK